MVPLLRLLSFRLGRGFCILAIAITAGCSGSAPGGSPVAQLTFEDTIDVVTAAGDVTPEEDESSDEPSQEPSDDPADDPASARATDEAKAIVAMVTDWYQSAFIDPAGWEDPSFPNVVRLFDGDARERVNAELESVTIGEARTLVRSVVPDSARIKVTLYLDQDGTPSYAVADVTFQATAALKFNGLPLTIAQTGTYFLHQAGDGWRIFSYQARNDQAEKKPATGTSP